MEISSPAFKQNDFIPKEYSCEGSDLSPELQWTDFPDGTQSFALISDDPDAPVGTWVHWVIYNIPSTAQGLSKAIATEKELADGTLQGLNDFRRVGYGGPCPLPGKAHRYFFKLYALDTLLDLGPGATKTELLEAMEGHILVEAECVGLYQR